MSQTLRVRKRKVVALEQPAELRRVKTPVHRVSKAQLQCAICKGVVGANQSDSFVLSPYLSRRPLMRLAANAMPHESGVASAWFRQGESS